MIVVEDVTVSYGNDTAVEGLDVSVGSSELLAVIGSSGSGKSTLLHTVAGLVKPSSGSVRVGDIDVYEMSEADRSSWRLVNVGLVFQFGELVPELSLADNVALPLMLAGVRRRDIGDRVGDLLDTLEIAEVADRRPGQVSGGQLQRAAIARALVHRPQILLADEPTGALDTTTGLLAMEALTDLAREQRTCLVVVTHDSRIASLCDREVVIRDGQITHPIGEGEL